MRQKIIATGAGLVLVGLASAGAFAAQHATTALELPVTTETVTATVTNTDTATITDTSTPGATETDTPTDTPTPGDTDTPTPGATDTSTPSDTDTPAPGSSETPTPEATSTSESGGQRDIRGIPEDNPGRGHHDGLCLKSPNGTFQVRVPCHAHGAETATPTAGG